MAFDLEIEFVGLCMFVFGPRIDDPGVRDMYVLLPQVTPSATIPPHVARLCVDTAYLQPASTQLHGLLAQAPLEGVGLGFRNRDPLDPSLPAELAAVPHRLDRAVIDDPGSLLTARVSLGSGVYLPPVRPREHAMCWEYPNAVTRQMLTTTITWTIKGMDGDHLDLELTPFVGNAPAPLPTLYPIGDTIKRIQLSIYHTEREMLPPNPQTMPVPAPGTKATHFSAYNILFDPPAEVFDPVFYGASCNVNGGAVPYTCMGPAQAPAIPG